MRDSAGIFLGYIIIPISSRCSFGCSMAVFVLIIHGSLPLPCVCFRWCEGRWGVKLIGLGLRVSAVFVNGTTILDSSMFPRVVHTNCLTVINCKTEAALYIGRERIHLMGRRAKKVFRLRALAKQPIWITYRCDCRRCHFRGQHQTHLPPLHGWSRGLDAGTTPLFYPL